MCRRTRRKRLHPETLRKREREAAAQKAEKRQLQKAQVAAELALRAQKAFEERGNGSYVSMDAAGAPQVDSDVSMDAAAGAPQETWSGIVIHS